MPSPVPATPDRVPSWSAMAGREASASRTGPFPYPTFLAAAEDAMGTPTDAIHITSSEGGAVALVIEDGVVRMAGPEHLTDYHAPLGPDAGIIAEALGPHAGRRFVLDSLPDDVAGSFEHPMRAMGMEVEVRPHESTAVLSLPPTYDDWLMTIGKKERHEVRRKRRRFEAEFGDVTIERAGADAVPMFCEMHRTSPGPKGDFMTDAMERFFMRLATEADASLHLLRCGGTVRAAAFGFETEDGFYYYNSAYDPDAAMASPGVVLLSALIAEQIARGASVFDFLKGDERYKYRHGAAERPLFTLVGRVP